MPRKYIRGTIEDRLEAYSDRSGGPDACWPWTGSTRRGYGLVSLPGSRSRNAHVQLWIVENGPIPEGMEVCHSCDNPSCINPRHLFLGTHDDNMKDAVNKGRFPRGSSAQKARLREEDIPVIRRVVQEGETRESVSKRYGVSAHAVSMIILGKTWKHVD